MPVSRAGCPARHTRTCSHGNFACREQYHHCRCRRYQSTVALVKCGVGLRTAERHWTGMPSPSRQAPRIPCRSLLTHHCTTPASTLLLDDLRTHYLASYLTPAVGNVCTRICLPQNEPLPRHCGASRSRYDQRRIHSTRETFHHAHEYYTDVATLLPTNRPCALITQHLWPISAKSQ